MSKKLIYLVSFVLVLSLVSSNVVFGGVVVESRVSGSSDDREHYVGGSIDSATSSDLEMPYEDTGKGSPQVVGMRFLNVEVPPGSNIANAYIEFVCDETKGGSEHVSLLIEGEPNPDPLTFTSDIIGRPRTTANAVWEPENWTAAGQVSQTSDISAVIREIVNLDGWKSGNSLVIIISDNPANPSEGIRCAESFDGTASQAPLLHIEYTTKYAHKPDPADGVLYADTWASLSWNAGETTTSHDVYFSDNFDDVNDGAESAFQGNQASTFFVVGFPGMPYPDGLVTGTTYYWRINEVEADGTTKYRGNIWSFTVPPRTAYDPDPVDGAKYVKTDVELSWMGGFGAKLHTVYFGENSDDVNNATGGLLQGTTTYTPGTLEMDKVYYWRVDEFDPPTTHKGDVWSFNTLPIIAITDPNLIGWWKFDEGSGSTALDWSGHGNDGKLGGGQNWVPGIMEGALDLRGSDYVMIDGVVDDMTSNDITLSAWIKTAQTGEGNVFASNDSGGSHVLLFGIDNGNVYVDDGSSTDWPPRVNDDQWHMITLVMRGSKIYLYTDGVQVATISTGIDITTETRWSIGQEWDSSPSDFYIGMVDDARFYNAALTVDEVKELMRGDPLVAWDPMPGNGSTPSLKDAMPLSWSPGDEASGHDVYFGTDKDAVDNADASDTTGIYRGRQSITSYSPPEGVEWGGGPYYWRIDEYNTDATISQGGIWSFTVADFILVEDFEDYNDYEPDRIFDKWIDGWGVPTNGSMVGYPEPDFTQGEHFVETNIVHGGSQSMPFFYDNNFKYSEASTTLSYPRNWTEEGVGVMSIWFRGNPASVGSFTEGPAGTYTMTASGADIWNQADEFHYAYKTLSGAGTIIAKVESVGNTDNWAKCGVMIRETLDVGSKFAAVYITPTNADGTAANGCRFQGRMDTDASAESDTSVATAEQMAVTAPYWVKLERGVGSSFRGYYSSNGITWQAMAWNPRSISMASNVYVGLALTSHNADATCEAKFSNVQISGTVGTQWTNQDIGILSNAAESMYVALNGNAAVYHDDPGAVQIATWTEWTIDLQEFAAQGVNLANVSTISIGFGDKNNLRAGGSGLVFFDDIRLYRPAP